MMSIEQWYLGALAILFAGVVAYFKGFKKMASSDNSELVVPIVPADASVKPLEPPTATQPISFTPSGFKPTIVAWARSVAKWEGSLSKTNPGNLKYSTLTKSWGATKGKPALDGGYFCEFHTYQDGFNALCNFLTLGAEGQLLISHPSPCTMEDFTKRFAGNPPQNYINGICKDLGITPSTLINSLLT